MEIPKVIYVVDDDHDVLKSVGRLLKLRGFASRLFPSAEAFEAGVDTSEATCLILDIRLGETSGIELRYKLSRSSFPVPVVFITADDSDATRQSAVAAGCVAYLRKPFTSKALVDAVTEAIG